MATNFPTSLDSFTNPVAGDSLASPSHAGQHADVNDAVEALQVKVGVGAHTLGEWTSFTPVFTNFTLGDGTVDARYCQINDVVLVSGRITLGSTSSVSGRIDINYPVGSQVSSQGFNGTVRYTDTGTASSAGWLVLYPNTFGFQVLNAAGTYVGVASTSATVPHTWAATDFIDFTMWYQKA